MSDEQARDGAAKEYVEKEYCSFPNENLILKECNQNAMARDFKAGWQSCLHGPAVTELYEAICEIDNLTAQHELAVLKVARKALDDFEKARGADE